MSYCLTITSRDYIPFNLHGSEPSLLTACMVMQAGFQVRQPLTIEVSTGRNSVKLLASKATDLVQAVTDCIEFLREHSEAE